MRQKAIKTKGFNEIYFVLYLAALILIIPNSENEVDLEIERLPSVYLKSEKSALNIRLSYQEGEKKLIAADTVNYIYPIGEFNNINYKISIRNNLINKVIFDNGVSQNIPAFEIKEEERGTLQFIWKIDSIPLTNKNYEVIVESEIEPKFQDEKIYQSTRFNLNIFIVDRFPVEIAELNRSIEINQDQQDSSSTQINSLSQTPIYREALGDIDFNLENPVANIALTRWTNKVWVFGLNLQSDLEGGIKIKSDEIDGFDSDLEIVDIQEKYFIISGNTPPGDNLKVNIELKRKEDGQISNSSFFVKPIPISPPDYPKVIYPYINYTFNGKVPSTNSANFNLKLFLDDEVIASSNTSKIEFTPVPEFAGKNIFFARYYNDELIGSRYPIKIQENPPPEIIQINSDGEKLRVTTKSFGFVAQGKSNFIKEIMNDSNINFVDLTGFTEFKDNFTIQVFESKNSIQGKIKLKAEDSYGKTSTEKVYDN